MSDVETIRALERIDRALARIETVATVAAAPPPPPAGDPALAERHDRLRARVRETLDKLDTLIAEGDA